MPVNGSVAPVCPTSRSQAPSGMPGVVTPAIPRATDLPSAIQAINQLIMMLQQPTHPNMFLQINNTMPFPMSRWVETNRVTTKVRIFNPNDNSQWVDVERISNLTFTDRSNNDKFNWAYQIPKTGYCQFDPTQGQNPGPGQTGP